MWNIRGAKVKKKIMSIIAVSMIFGSVVSAAGIWGTYKGNQVIRITSNGNTLKTSDVPAISYNGRTMIPISMLSQIGLNYKWDQKNQTVNVSNSNISSNQEAEYADYFYELQMLGVVIRELRGTFNLQTSNFLSGSVSFEELTADNDKIFNIINQSIDAFNELNNQSTKFKDSDIINILTNYQHSLEAAQNALNAFDSLIKEETTKQKIQLYNDSINNGYEHAMRGISLSSQNYKEYINKIK